MDTILLFSIFLGILHMSQAQGQKVLKCIECEHIGWNQTYTFESAHIVYGHLQSKYNPACAMSDPLDQNMYQQTIQNQQNQQNQPQFQPGQTGNQFNNFFQNRYDVRETICPVYAETNRCNYVHGLVRVKFLNYQNAEMTLEMHVRNCINALSEFKDGCYLRNSKHTTVLNFLQDRLPFLGNVEVLDFVGEQCYCRTDMCAIVSSSRTIVPSGLLLLSALLTVIVIKQTSLLS